jgi:micrococcal nuclease
MEHRQPPHRTSQPRRKGITTTQIAVLFVVGMLNIGLLALAVIFLLPGHAAPGLQAAAATATQTPDGSPAFLVTWTPSPVAPPVTNASPAANASPVANASPLAPLPQLPASCANGSKEIRQGTVTRVVDRETIEVNLDGALVPVGFAGLSFPSGSELEPQALSTLRALADGRPVILAMDVSGQDGQGRLVRYVFAGGRFLNAEIIRLGFAQVDPNAPDQACAVELQQAEGQARTAQVGIWQPTPVPTHTFVPFVTVNPNTACDCSVRYTCSDFRTHADAQACFNACNDYNSLLDEDHDGLACENLP